MKIKLLNDGDYGDMDGVKFPVEVEGIDWHGVGFEVTGEELIRVGASADYWDKSAVYYWSNEEISK